MSTQRKALLVIFLTVFIDLLGFGIVMPMLARYAKELNASGATIGLLMASFSAMQFIFAPLWGRLSDRVGRRPVLILGLVGSVIFYGLFGYASTIKSLSLLFFSRIGAGIAGATGRPGTSLADAETATIEAEWRDRAGEPGTGGAGSTMIDYWGCRCAVAGARRSTIGVGVGGGR